MDLQRLAIIVGILVIAAALSVPQEGFIAMSMPTIHTGITAQTPYRKRC